MIAIVQDGGRQYRVEEGQTLLIDRRDSAPGDTLELQEVLSIENDGEFKMGQPMLNGASVKAEVLGEVKGPKVIFHRFRRRQGSRTRFGHRQRYTQIRIQSIQA